MSSDTHEPPRKHKKSKSKDADSHEDVDAPKKPRKPKKAKVSEEEPKLDAVREGGEAALTPVTKEKK